MERRAVACEGVCSRGSFHGVRLRGCEGARGNQGGSARLPLPQPTALERCGGIGGRQTKTKNGPNGRLGSSFFSCVRSSELWNATSNLQPRGASVLLADTREETLFGLFPTCDSSPFTALKKKRVSPEFTRSNPLQASLATSSSGPPVQVKAYIIHNEKKETRQDEEVDNRIQLEGGRGRLARRSSKMADWGRGAWGRRDGVTRVAGELSFFSGTHPSHRPKAALVCRGWFRHTIVSISLGNGISPQLVLPIRPKGDEQHRLGTQPTA